jgi:hypothetical protein
MIVFDRDDVALLREVAMKYRIALEEIIQLPKTYQSGREIAGHAINIAKKALAD